MTWNDEIPIRQDSDDAAPHIVEMMGAVDVDLDPDAVRLLISQARLAHRRCLSDWLRQNEPVKHQCNMLSRRDRCQERPTQTTLEQEKQHETQERVT